MIMEVVGYEIYHLLCTLSSSSTFHSLGPLTMPNPHSNTPRKEICLYDLDRLGLILLEPSILRHSRFLIQIEFSYHIVGPV
jgi:hypothetical protein